MIKLARITTQKKNKDRYNIYLSDGKKEYYAFSIDESILVKHRLHKGMELEEAFVHKLTEEDTVYKAYASAIFYLSYRMRSEKEVYDYLVEKEYEEYHIPEVMQRLINEKLIDDLEFARMFVRTRINTTNKGPQIVKKELMEKGVKSSIADEALKLFTYDVQYERAVKIVEKRQRQKRKDSLFEQRQKLRANLMQNGFTAEIIDQVMSLLEEEISENQLDEQWEAVKYHGERIIRRQSVKHSGFMLMNKVKEGLYRRAFPQELISKFCDEIDWDTL